MRLRLEVTKCEGYGNCAAHLEEVFTLDEWGYAALENDGLVPEGAEDRAKRAIADCPVHAISVAE
jgi:ferredoxin